VLHLPNGMHAGWSSADARFRFLGHLDLGEQCTRRRIPPWEIDAGGFADQTVASIAPDEILRPQTLAVGHLDVDAGVVLREAHYFASAIDRHWQLAEQAGEDALDFVL